MPVARVPHENTAKHFRGFKRGANGRLERRNNRGPWRQNGRLQGSKTKCLLPECLVEAAAQDFKGWRAGKREV